MYLIPSRVLAGRVRIVIRAYTSYIVGDASGLFAADVTVAKGGMQASA
jgi:hypothetical protein